ncbi:hypothetical protein IGJ19_001447 [Enterococcus sp. DIV1368b]|uniref:Uncharacterized protein n=1 Tax=Enterococcus mundtii TaxID=53346 RepID=A0A242KZZ5_ENTMU|nr:MULTISPECIES: hypothetical protein [Enterococcus]MDB7087890.1 hypothetical protein [Enterococcus mundtii]OTP27348.1 hypothetical protein A5802_001083 [Enterococcus mundtii]STD24109.1 Uncharacterised protein [Enterococcus mundtii]
MTDVPKAVKAEMAASMLKIKFDNGETRYLKSHLAKEHAEAFSMKNGKRKNSLLASQTTWVGSTIEIQPDGTLVLNENDYYSPEELWNESKEHII